MIDVSSRELLRLVEGFDLVGSWRWIFASREHAWSRALYRILGLDPAAVTPGYDRLLQCVHPEDRFDLETPDEVPLTGLRRERVFRVLRPDGTLRTLRSLAEIAVAPDGRPIEASGLLVDVSDHEILARAREADRRRNRLIFEKVGAFTSTSAFWPFRDFSTEWLELTGLPKQALLAEPTLPIPPDERPYWVEHGRQQYLAKTLVHTNPHLRLANGDVVKYRMIMVPTLREDGSVALWTNFVAPDGWQLPQIGGDLREGLEQAIEGRHLRAARALLDWSMTDLARASGLSLSTVRRLEEEVPKPGERSRPAAIAALRQAGIRFALVDGDVAVGGGGRMRLPA